MNAEDLPSWLCGPPWNQLSSSELRAELADAAKDDVLLNGCLRVLGELPKLIDAAGDPPVAPRDWDNDEFSAMEFGSWAGSIGAVADLSTESILELKTPRATWTALTREEARDLSEVLYRRYLRNVLHEAIFLLSKDAGFTVEQRLQVIPTVRAHWAEYDRNSRTFLVRHLAATRAGEVVIPFLEDLSTLKNEPAVTGWIEDCLKNLRNIST